MLSTVVRRVYGLQSRPNLNPVGLSLKLSTLAALTCPHRLSRQSIMQEDVEWERFFFLREERGWVKNDERGCCCCCCKLCAPEMGARTSPLTKSRLCNLSHIASILLLMLILCLAATASDFMSTWPQKWNVEYGSEKSVWATIKT